VFDKAGEGVPPFGDLVAVDVVAFFGGIVIDPLEVEALFGNPVHELVAEALFAGNLVAFEVEPAEVGEEAADAGHGVAGEMLQLSVRKKGYAIGKCFRPDIRAWA